MNSSKSKKIKRLSDKKKANDRAKKIVGIFGFREGDHVYDKLVEQYSNNRKPCSCYSCSPYKNKFKDKNSNRIKRKREKGDYLWE